MRPRGSHNTCDGCHGHGHGHGYNNSNNNYNNHNRRGNSNGNGRNYGPNVNDRHSTEDMVPARVYAKVVTENEKSAELLLEAKSEIKSLKRRIDKRPTHADLDKETEKVAKLMAENTRQKEEITELEGQIISLGERNRKLRKLAVSVEEDDDSIKSKTGNLLDFAA